jgi:cellulose synthase/poly-beta-1,6-N-acetylglucosamine synthase-like glycosyltransferase
VIPISTLLVVLGVYLAAYVTYQTLLMLANAIIPSRVDAEPRECRAFNVIVPAHNEEIYVSRLLRTLADQEYPRASYRVTVVADNCTDRTVEQCRAFDVDILERTDRERTGKGYAIRWALDRLQVDRWEAIVIVDADSLVCPAFLRSLNSKMAAGYSVIQTFNGVANPNQSWFTRLLTGIVVSLDGQWNVFRRAGTAGT